MPRNLKAYVAAQELHSAIERIVREKRCSHCGDAPSAKNVLAYLSSDMQRDPKTIRKHIAAVMKDLAASRGTVSAD